MASKRSLPELKYSPEHLPPRVIWNMSVNIPRNEVGSLCEQLHSLVTGRGGACFYYPDLENNRTRCRYEWHRSWNRRKFALRVGVVVDVGADDVTEIEGYATTKEIAETLTGPAPTLRPTLVASIQRELISTLEKAEKLKAPEKQTDYFVVFHIETPPHHGFLDSVSSVDGTFRFVRTRIIKDRNRRISAVIVKERAGSKELAKAAAFADLLVACALLTLGESQRYEHTTLSWPRFRPRLMTVPSPDAVSEDRLYERRKRWPQLETTDNAVITRFNELWAAYEALSAPDRDLFRSALFAYYAATQRHRDSSTLNVIAFSAALSALAAELRVQCSGSLACNICGPIPLKHDLVGEAAAIMRLIAETCGITSNQQLAEVRALIQRVYRKQRSAFVHGAQFRHEEYGQGLQLPTHLPTNDAPVQDLLEYEQDLQSIGRLARRTLLQWLEKRGGLVVGFERYGINPERIAAKSFMSMHISFASAGIVGFAVPQEGRDA